MIVSVTTPTLKQCSYGFHDNKKKQNKEFVLYIMKIQQHFLYMSEYQNTVNTI
jgi:hypothetical protein